MRIRKSVDRDKKMQFTNLWHHVYDQNRLREAYYGLNPQSAPGIDLATLTGIWKETKRRTSIG